MSGDDNLSERGKLQLTSPYDYSYLGGGPPDIPDNSRMTFDDLIADPSLRPHTVSVADEEGDRARSVSPPPTTAATAAPVPKKKDWAKNNVIHGKGFSEEQRKANAVRDAETRKKALVDRMRSGQVTRRAEGVLRERECEIRKGIVRS